MSRPLQVVQRRFRVAASTMVLSTMLVLGGGHEVAAKGMAPVLDVGAPAVTAALSGDVAFLGRGMRVEAVAVASQRRTLGWSEPLPGRVVDLAVADDQRLAVLATDGWLRVLDIRAPSDMPVVGAVPVGPGDRVVAQGDLALVRHSSELVWRALDLGALRVDAGAVRDHSDRLTFAVTLADRRMYLSRGRRAGVDVWDLSDGDTPRRIGGFAGGESVAGLAVEGSRAFALVDLGRSTSAVVVFDLTQQGEDRDPGEEDRPAMALKVGQLTIDGAEVSGGGVAVEGQRLVVATTAGWTVVDVAQEPRRVAHLPDMRGEPTMANEWALVGFNPRGHAVRLVDLATSPTPRVELPIDSPALIGPVVDAEGQTVVLSRAGPVRMDEGVPRIIDADRPTSGTQGRAVATFGQGLVVTLEAHATAPDTAVLRLFDPALAPEGGLGQIELATTWSSVVTADGPRIAVVSRPVTGQPGRLMVVDAQDPSEPRPVFDGSMEWGPPTSAVLQDRWLYIAEARRVHVVDLAVPSRPLIVGRVAVAGPVSQMELDGARLYLVARGQMQVLDVADPRRPRLQGNIDLAGTGRVISGSGRTVAVASDLPQRLGTDESGELVVEQPASTVVEIFDVRDPRQPAVAGSIRLPARPSSVLHRDDRVDVILEHAGLWRLAVSEDVATTPRPQPPSQRIDPSAPWRAPSPGLAVERTWGGRGSTLDRLGNRALIGRGPLVELWDLGEDGGSSRTGIVELPARVSGVRFAAAGRLAVVADVIGGLSVLDLEDSSGPRVAASLSTSGVQGFVTDPRRTLVHVDQRWRLLELENAERPRLAAEITATLRARAQLVGDRLYAPRGTAGIAVVALPDGEAPMQEAVFAPDRIFSDVRVRDGMAWGLERGRTLRAYKLPADWRASGADGSARQVGVLQPPGLRAEDARLALDGSLAAIGSRDGLLLVDAARPDAPRLLGRYAAPADQLAWGADDALITGREEGLVRRIELLDPRMPTQSELLESLPDARGLTWLGGNTVAVADRLRGLMLLDVRGGHLASSGVPMGLDRVWLGGGGLIAMPARSVSGGGDHRLYVLRRDATGWRARGSWRYPEHRVSVADVHGLDETGRRTLVLTHDLSLHMVDLSDPWAPRLHWTRPITGLRSAAALDIHGGVAWVAGTARGTGAGIVVATVVDGGGSPPPTVMLSDIPSSVVVRDGRLHVGTATGLEVFEVQDGQVRPFGRIQLGGPVPDMDVHGDLVFAAVADQTWLEGGGLSVVHQGALRVVDLGGSTPRLVAEAPQVEPVLTVQRVSDRIVIGMGDAGARTYRWTAPQALPAMPEDPSLPIESADPYPWQLWLPRVVRHAQ